MPRAQKDEFDKIAPGFLKALKAKNESLRGWSGIPDSAELRRLLSSAEYAKQRAPNTPQSKWLQLIVQMMQQAEKQDLQTEVFSAMLKTRDSAPSVEIKLDDGLQ